MTSVAMDVAPRGCRGRQVCLEAMAALDIDHDDVLQSRVLRYLSFIDELQVRKTIHLLCTRCAMPHSINSNVTLLQHGFYRIGSSLRPPLFDTVCTLDEVEALFCVALCIVSDHNRSLQFSVRGRPHARG